MISIAPTAKASHQSDFMDYLNNEVPTWEQMPKVERHFMIDHTRLMALRLFELGGKDLLPDARFMSPIDLAQQAFEGEFVLLSHDPEKILNYGNRWAMALWRTTWEELTEMPSEDTTPSELRAQRAKALKSNYRDGYFGVRFSEKTGQRFEIGPVTLWGLKGDTGDNLGLAAQFSEWRLL